MRQLILASAWTCFLCAILRVLPEMPHAWNSEHAPDEEGVEQYGLHNWLPHSSAIYFLHVSCILNAAVGPMCMATVAKISCVWFPAEERTISTAIAITGGSLGSSLGFIFGPILVPDSSPESMPIYLLVQLLLCTIALLACLIYMPAKPSHYPSPAARTLDTTLPVPFLPSLVEAFRHRDLMLLSISNGILNGTFNCWAGVLSTILPDVGQTTCGWLSFGATASSSTSSVLIGLASTDRRVRTRLKSLCIISSALTALLLAWFSLSTSSSVLASYALLPSSQGALFSAVILAGLALGVAIPLAYEFAAEMTYPLPEGVSGGVLSGVNNAAGIVFLFLSPACSGRTMNALMVMTAVGCTLLLVPVREVYRRMDEEEEDKERVDGYQKMDDHTSDGMATSKAGQQHMSLNGTTATR